MKKKITSDVTKDFLKAIRIGNVEEVRRIFNGYEIDLNSSFIIEINHLTQSCTLLIYALLKEFHCLVTFLLNNQGNCMKNES